MSGHIKTIGEIQSRINKGKAVVYTADEFKKLIRNGKKPTLDEVDVVTAGSFGVVSGTMAVMCIPVAEAGVFKRAENLTLNGVPTNIGPCPNESLGLVDITVNGTAHRDMTYGGGHLFRDLVAGHEVEVSVETDDGRTIKRMITLDEIPYAKMITTRSFFKNYSCFATPEEDVDTIFRGPESMRGGWKEATFSGCGDINPIQNDPECRFLKTGAGVFVNGAPGIVLGPGTRSNSTKPNLSVEADMHLMKPEYMGGFKTSAGPECTISIGTAFPVTDQKTLDDLSVLNEDSEMPLCDVRDRKPICIGNYSSVWKDDNYVVKADLSRCIHCTECNADIGCPRDASPSKGIDRSLCMECGNCVSDCKGHAFSCDMGYVEFKLTNGNKKDVPIVQRQSSRRIGMQVCEELKDLVTNGRWSLGLFENING